MKRSFFASHSRYAFVWCAALAISAALAGDLNLLRELRGQPSGDVVDAALDTAQDEISSQLAEVESRELASIENALERMRDGQYGVCEGCSCSIPMARLNALPYATLCIDCQREMERYPDWGRAGSQGSWDRVYDTPSHDDHREVRLSDIEIDLPK